MSIFKILLGVSLCLGLSQIYAQEKLPLSLEEAIERALENNKQLELKSLERELQFQQITVRKRKFIPEISAYANYFQYLDDKPVYIFPDNSNAALSGPVELGAPLNFYTGVRVNQHILDFSMFTGGGTLQRANELMDLQKQISEDEVRYEVIKSYYQAQVIDDGLSLLAFNRQRLGKLRSITETSVNNELALPTTLDELDLRNEEISIREDEILNQENQLHRYLKFLCGIPGGTEILLTDNPPPASVAISEKDSARGKEWELLELQYELANTRTALEKSDNLPTIDLYMAFQWMQQEGYGDLFGSEGSWFNQHLIGVKLNVPILSPRNRKSKDQEGRINQEIIRTQQALVDARNDMERQNAVEAMQIAQRNLELAERKSALYQTLYEKAEIRYTQEYSSLADFLEAEDKIRSARLDEFRKKIDYFIAILEVYKAYDMLESFNQSR